MCLDFDTFCALQADRIKHLSCSGGGKANYHSRAGISLTPADSSKNWKAIEYRQQLLRLAGGTGEQARAARAKLHMKAAVAKAEAEAEDLGAS